MGDAPSGPQLYLLGGFALVVQARAIPLARVSERLFALLGLAQRPVPRPVAAETLWPDRTTERSLANLRATLWRLPTEVREFVVDRGGSLALSDAVDVDLRALVENARSLLSGAAPAEVPCDAEDLLTDLLPFWDDDWVMLERERLRHLRLHALEALASLLCRRREWPLATHVAALCVDAEPLRESAVRVLIEAHLGAGNVAEASRVWDRHRRLVHEELGVSPSEAFAELIGVATRH